jgi:hypothetical protein
MMDTQRWKEARERGNRRVRAKALTGFSSPWISCPEQPRSEAHHGWRRRRVDLSARPAFPTLACDRAHYRRRGVTVMLLVCMSAPAGIGYCHASGVRPGIQQGQPPVSTPTEH